MILKLTFLIPLLEDPNQGLSDLLEKHWYIKERFEKALQERDYVDFKNCVLRGKVSHRTLASMIGEEELLRQVNGWNPGNWNWHTMKVFSERRAHPYQRERVRAPPLSERGESTSLSEGRASGQRSRRITHHRAETRQSTESDEGVRKRTELISSDIMRLDQELLTPLLSPIVSDISEIKTFVTNHSALQSLHNKALHQTQLIMKESASLIKPSS